MEPAKYYIAGVIERARKEALATVAQQRHRELQHARQSKKTDPRRAVLEELMASRQKVSSKELDIALEGRGLDPVPPRTYSRWRRSILKKRSGQ